MTTEDKMLIAVVVVNAIGYVVVAWMLVLIFKRYA